MRIKKSICLIAFLLTYYHGYCQLTTNNSSAFSLTVLDEKLEHARGASVELMKDNKLVKAAITDAKGIAIFEKIDEGSYTFSVTYSGYTQQITGTYSFPSSITTDTIILQPASATLQEVNVIAHKPLIQQIQGKIIVNVDASVTNVGATVLEVLEKSPGVTVDRNGGIVLQGKAGVLIMIDDKPTYLSGADLNNLLSSMSSAQVEQIELMANPSAKYDASGNAGIINIKTKKNKLKGFNGSFTISAGQGVHTKNNNSLILNYRKNKLNTFFNYNMNLVNYFIDLYALRKYYSATDTLVAELDQPSRFSGTFLNNTIKTGLDYYVTPKATVGIVLSGTFIQRHGNNGAKATWLNPAGTIDSSIGTKNKNSNNFKNGAINVNFRQSISSSQDISMDADWLYYDMRSEQHFDNHLNAAGGYTEETQASIPTTINIFSGKADYTSRFRKNITLQCGWKLSDIDTHNIAFYQNFDGTQWIDDDTKSNHFLYKENINAFYSTIEKKYERISIQLGLRYENTSYHAHQLGNAIQKDSAFSRKYDGLFPSGYMSYQADSSNAFTLTAGRRIDRPAFQVLNPFYFIINKYTYETGNPNILPQYTWNLAVSHQYKEILTTTISYSIIKNYFSQLFLADTAKGILLYSQGNVGRTTNIGASCTLAIPLFKWWSLTTEANYNHKQLKGFNGNTYASAIDQLTFNVTNQVTIAKKYTAEISGSYTSKARNDIQELLYPTGQLSFGVSRLLLKNKGTIKFSARDILYTDAMEGLTQFPDATEYFIIRRDTRVLTLSFTYRFGKAFKVAKRSEGSAGDEIDRVGNG